jgi:peptidoglycan hydrolase-like protein with peptidoglycan-binding domain
VHRALPLRLIVAISLAATVATALTGCKATANASAPKTTAVTPSAPAASAPSTPATPTPSPSANPTVKPAPPRTLKFGNSGADVLALQQRLTDLGYWLGKPDGKFGGTTRQAVYALQKVAGIGRSGTVTASTRKALDAGVRPTGRNKTGSDIEVDLRRNVVLFVTDGQVKYIINTSTGGGYTYYSQGTRSVAVTPKGHFHTGRTINAMHRSPLGLMYRPRYFNGGIAIHGDSSVPAHPASHGCVRVSNAAMDWVWSSNLDPVGTSVWVY